MKGAVSQSTVGEREESMPLIYYIQTSAIGLIITLIIAFHMLRRGERRTSSHRIFGAMVASNISLLVLEMLLNIFTSTDSSWARVLLPIIVLLFYIMNPVPEALWVVYLDTIIRKKQQGGSRLLLVLVLIPLLSNFLLSLVSVYNGALFYIDATNTYHRGPFFGLMVLSCYSYLLYNIGLILFRRKSIPRNEFWVAFFVALFPLVAGALQSMFYGISLLWTALSFSLLIAYMNLQNEQVYKELQALDKMKDEFLTNTSHELRTPLNGIINITGSMLETGNENLTPVQTQNLQVVVSSARRLYSMINDILTVSSLKSGQIRLSLQAADLHSIAGATLYVLNRLKGEKDIVFTNNIPEGLPPVAADVERLYQILYNLLGNALKFTREGSVEAGAVAREGYAEIWVQDTGCGIPDDKQEDIFKAFYMIDSAETRGTSGSGLGLAITKQLVELHGGTIRVVSKEEGGSRFSFTLPFSRSDGQHMNVERKVEAPGLEADIPVPNYMTTNKEQGETQHAILMADDDPASLAALYTILSNEGYHVKAVSNGEAVLEELARKNGYDLVILDVMMPRISGYEVIEKIRLRFQPIDLPVLFLTAKARPEDLQFGFESGANDYLSKPFEAQELKSRVKTLIQLKSSLKARMDSELLFLQAQIKPHFLYNSLSVIAALIAKEPEHAEELLYDLSDYLRGSFHFNNDNGFTSLSNELVTVRAYVSIEKERFKDRLHVEFDVEDEQDILIPMLSIQPLVENAIRHGVSRKPGGGKVRLSIKRSGNGLVITVEDNGVGIPAKKLSNLLTGKDGNEGVGLGNIQRRMLLHYGYGLELHSVEGQGTTVVMKISNNGE